MKTTGIETFVVGPFHRTARRHGLRLKRLTDEGLSGLGDASLHAYDGEIDPADRQRRTLRRPTSDERRRARPRVPPAGGLWDTQTASRCAPGVLVEHAAETVEADHRAAGRGRRLVGYRRA